MQPPKNGCRNDSAIFWNTCAGGLHIGFGVPRFVQVIHAAEALFSATMNPRTPIGSASRPKLTAIHKAIVSILRHTVKSACRAYSRPGGFQEVEDFPLAVYGREGESCIRCEGVIRRITQGGRSTYYCPKCQR